MQCLVWQRNQCNILLLACPINFFIDFHIQVPIESSEITVGFFDYLDKLYGL